MVKNLSKESTCKINVPDIAALLCIEEILNALYTKKTQLYICIVQDELLMLDAVLAISSSLDCLPLIVQRLILHLPIVIAMSGEQS